VIVRTIDTVYGPLPVIDTLKECRYIKNGWCGIDERGERVNVYSQSKDIPAIIPTDPAHLVIVRAAVGNELSFAGRVPVGAILIERAARGKAKRKPPSNDEG
jgi:hypothetical protein